MQPAHLPGSEGVVGRGDGVGIVQAADRDADLVGLIGALSYQWRAALAAE